MRRFLPLALIAACAACAADQPPAPQPAAWIGQTEAQLVAAYGIPTRVYEVQGRRFLSYDSAGSAPMVVPSLGFGFGGGSGGWGSWSGVGTGLGLSFGSAPAYCTTTFELQADRVVTANRTGPGCG